MKRKELGLLAMLALMLALSGCLFRPPDDLYKLPEVSPGYEQLETAIREVKTGLEAEFGTATDVAVILSGDNTATIQLQDLDGDGLRESAVTFVRVPGVEKSLKIYIFEQLGEYFRVTGVIEGDGAAIYAVDYVDLNGSGSKELVVNWQISAGVYQLGVYTLDELSRPRPLPSGGGAPSQPVSRSEVLATELLLTSCSGASDGASISSGYLLLDFERDAVTELALVRIDAGGLGSQVAVYGWREGSFVQVTSVGLSSGIVSLYRLRSNYIRGDMNPPALYVTGVLADGSRVTDVIAYQGEQLVNLAADPGTGVSREILRGYTDVSHTDINGDLVLELPTPIPLPTYGDASAANFWLIDWGQYQESGERLHVLTTYHNMADSWYLEVPEEWRDKITISRRDQVSGQREVVFSLWKGEEEEPEPFLSIYRLTGNNKTAPASGSGRFVLREEETALYAARFYNCSWDCGMDENGLLQRFRTIQTSWYYN